MATTVPAFASDVRVWFAQLESYFVANNATEQRLLPILFNAFPTSSTSVLKDLMTETLFNFIYDRVLRGKFFSGRCYQLKKRFCKC